MLASEGRGPTAHALSMCVTCLAADRTLSSLQKTPQLLNICNGLTLSMTNIVCYECRARLDNFVKFRSRALHAKKLLSCVPPSCHLPQTKILGNCTSTRIECLSTLEKKVISPNETISIVGDLPRSFQQRPLAVVKEKLMQTQSFLTSEPVVPKEVVESEEILDPESEVREKAVESEGILLYPESEIRVEVIKSEEILDLKPEVIEEVVESEEILDLESEVREEVMESEEILDLEPKVREKVVESEDFLESGVKEDILHKQNFLGPELQISVEVKKEFCDAELEDRQEMVESVESEVKEEVVETEVVLDPEPEIKEEDVDITDDPLCIKTVADLKTFEECTDKVKSEMKDDDDAASEDTSVQASNSGLSNKDKGKIKQNTTSYDGVMSDDGDFEWSSSSWDGEDKSSSSDEAEQNTRKKRNKVTEDGKVGDFGLKEKKKRKERSLNKNSGLACMKKGGTVSTPKTMKENPCKPDKKCPHNCHEISEERRQHIFDFYYNLSSQRKRDWLVVNSQAAEMKRKRTKEYTSRRQKTYNYFINEGEGHRQVCQKFLLHTLDLSQRFVHYTISNAESNLAKRDLRGKHIPANKTSTLIKQGVVDYIKNLPAVPSHYCRNDSTRLYLPQEFKNLTHLYQLYKTDYTSKGKDYVGEKVFKNIFATEFNITFHVPKKDKCKICVSFANNPTNDTEEEKKVHLKEVKDSKARFKFHQNITKRDTHTLCVSFDLQKVLNTPYGESILFYYTRKYCVYNLSFYETNTREEYCYSWGESDGKRGGNEIATILLKYIQKVDERQTIKYLLLYSDSCSGQIKNQIVFAAVHTALQACQHIKTVQINFLLPGHTSMPVDSVHTVIENSIKNTVIHAPSQWPTVFTLARKKPKPYNVETLKHSDFVAWDSISDQYFKNDLVGKFSQLRVITFKKSDPTHVIIKKSMGTESETEKVLAVGKNRAPSKLLYKQPLPISEAKYKDLVSHCKSSAIPQQFHDEYLKMPHGNIRDTLPDTDVEDSD